MTATLAGVHLHAAGEVGWPLCEGTQPHQRLLRVTLADAQGFDKLKQQVTLLTDDGLEVQRLSILSIEPSISPEFREVRISDSRWTWSGPHVARSYNVRRGGNDTRRLVQEGVPEQIQAVVQDVQFAGWSLYPREDPVTPWTARQILEDVLKVVVGKEGKDWLIQAAFNRKLEVSLELDDPGDVALQKALALIPGHYIWIRNDGVAIVDDQFSGAEAKILSVPNPVAGPRMAAKVDMKRVRPGAVQILFDRELELRFDSAPESDGSVGSALELVINLLGGGARAGAGGGTGVTARVLENVAPVPDQYIIVNGVTKPTGSWVTFDELFANWPKPDFVPYKLSPQVVQKWWFVPRFVEFFSKPPLAQQADAVLASRVITVKDYYRLQYRIARFWLDRFRSWRATRVGVIDEERGIRGVSVVYGETTFRLSSRGIAIQASDGPATLFLSCGKWAEKLKDAQAGSARIVQEDKDVGILRVIPHGRLSGQDVEVIPCGVINATSSDAKDAKNGSGILTQYVRLKSDHKFATILTAIPAAPNDERRFHREIVTPAEASERMGIKFGECLGPVKTIRVTSDLIAPRWEWSDERVDAVETAFGVRGAPGFVDLGPAMNAKDVREVALAAACAVYANGVDKVEGTHEVPWNPKLTPGGACKGVSHARTPTGDRITSASFPRPFVTPDLYAYMKDELRRRLQKIQ